MMKGPIRDRLRSAIRSAFPDLAMMLLFGSRARGDARADSDYDVAVFLQGYDGNAEAVFRLGV
ncbi:MAG: nucleotidyltransferase domain-containing protein [Alphaproteobacteria bacterium]